MSRKIGLVVTHAQHVPERRAPMQRLRDLLGTHPDHDEWALGPYYENTLRAKNHEWSEHQWRWAAGFADDVTHVLFLQDDQVVPENLAAIVEAMVEAVPGEILSFHTTHRIAREMAREGRTWLTTSDYCVGTGYVWPAPLLREFLAWRETRVRPGWLERIHEDDLMGLFALTTGRRIWQPVPSPIKHDLTLESLGGTGDTPNRSPLVTWDMGADFNWTPADLEDPLWWTPQKHVPDIGRFYEHSLRNAVRAVDGFDQGAALASEARCALCKKPERGATGRSIVVCTPTRSGGHPQHHVSMWRLWRILDVEFHDAWELWDAWKWNYDLVRVRSRMLRKFKHDTTGTDILWLDDDVIFEPRVIAGMIGVKKDIVFAPYPRRDEPVGYHAWRGDIGKVQQAMVAPDSDGTAEVDSGPLGCCLMSRRAVDVMWEHYMAQSEEPSDAELDALIGEGRIAQLRDGVHPRQVAHAMLREAFRMGRARPDLRFDDYEDKRLHPSLALFQLAISQRAFAGGFMRALCSEDTSFMDRARAAGVTVHMYLGPGSPVDHVGEKVFKGDLAFYGLSRQEA